MNANYSRVDSEYSIQLYFFLYCQLKKEFILLWNCSIIDEQKTFQCGNKNTYEQDILLC